MEYDRESRELLLDLVENVESEWRWNETARSFFTLTTATASSFARAVLILVSLQ